MKTSIIYQQASKYLILALFVAGLYACDKSRIYESNIDIPKEGWHRDQRAKFQVEITDTVNACNVYINVRNNSQFKYMNLWIFVDVFSPSGKAQRDTLKIMMADLHGKWLGNGLGDKFDNRLLFQQNIRFPTSGIYTFEYEQAMRDEPLIGIDDIGLRIELNR